MGTREAKLQKKKKKKRHHKVVQMTFALNFKLKPYNSIACERVALFRLFFVLFLVSATE